MLALKDDVVDAVWAALEPMLPVPIDRHPLGCHRPRTPNFVCFKGILIRLVTGCSWDVAGHLAGSSESALRRRRDEWQAAKVFDKLVREALAAYDRIIGIDVEVAALDASIHKAPTGGEGTGPSFTDRGKRGWKWSLLTDGQGIPIGWTAAAANRNDAKLVADTLDDANARGLLAPLRCIYLDKGYDYDFVRDEATRRGLNFDIAKRRPRSPNGQRRETLSRGARHLKPAAKRPPSPRWPVERTNSWLSNYGLLRRNTDRFIHHRRAALDLAIALTLVIKLVKHQKRWGNLIT
jgi:transposase